MPVIDANIVLRYLLDDDETLAQSARNIIEGGAIGLPVEVLCEVVYVLQKVYQIPRDDISPQLARLVLRANIALSRKPAILDALGFFAASNLDFVDCVLAGYANAGEQAHTFDKKLARFIEELPRKELGETHTDN
ncbi:MAG: PIN domain-containing protein [Zoogloeaceae bacterium]|jgi:predicted nucleic-acid-binding protein|nr:PIN domain-containing protein [Zoogloeaceae bacterium]